MHAAEPPQGATPEPTPDESSELHGGLDATVRFYACEWPLLRRLSGCFGSNPVVGSSRGDCKAPYVFS
jgi:hypothetical protein